MWYVKLLKYLYRSVKIESVQIRLLRIITRSEGGEMYSSTLRDVYRKKHNIDVGLYSYGSCFDTKCTSSNVVVGRYCSIADGVKIMNRNHSINFISTHPFFYNSKLGYCKKDLIKFKPKLIGNDVWIGANALILPNVSNVGDGAVVGAGAVVTKNVPPYAIVAGNPASIIRYRFSKAVIRELLEMKWWENSIDKLKNDENFFKTYSNNQSDTNSIENMQKKSVPV